MSQSSNDRRSPPPLEQIASGSNHRDEFRIVVQPAKVSEFRPPAKSVSCHVYAYFWCVALLPVTAIQIYDEFELHRLRQIEIRNQALSLAKLAGAEQQQIVQGIREVLIAMSEFPSIKAKDGEACNAYLLAIRQRFPAFITFIVTDLNGVSFCDTNSDHRPINIDKRKYFATALKTGAFTVGEFSAGLSTGRRVIQFALPFYGTNGRMGGIIVAALSLDWLGDHIGRKGILGELRLGSQTATAPISLGIPTAIGSLAQRHRSTTERRTTAGRSTFSTKTASSELKATLPWAMIQEGLLSALVLTRRRRSARSSAARTTRSHSTS